MSASELADYSACVVLLVRGGTAYILEVFRDRLEYPDSKRKVIEYYRRWAAVARNYSLLIENKGSGMSLIQDLRQHNIFAIRIAPDGDKVMRMNRVTARIEAGAVVLPSRASWLQDFRREISAFPVGRHDDQVDALSQALDRAFNYRIPLPPPVTIREFDLLMALIRCTLPQLHARQYRWCNSPRTGTALTLP